MERLCTRVPGPGCSRLHEAGVSRFQGSCQQQLNTSRPDHPGPAQACPQQAVTESSPVTLPAAEHFGEFHSSCTHDLGGTNTGLRQALNTVVKPEGGSQVSFVCKSCPCASWTTGDGRSINKSRALPLIRCFAAGLSGSTAKVFFLQPCSPCHSQPFSTAYGPQGPVVEEKQGPWVCQKGLRAVHPLIT